MCKHKVAYQHQHNIFLQEVPEFLTNVIFVVYIHVYIRYHVTAINVLFLCLACYVMYDLGEIRYLFSFAMASFVI